MKREFSPGDKVFAKVRGYPPWPARIEGCADETPNKMKFHVYFYGTGETAVIKKQDVFDFIQNKNKFGKLKKHKNFSEGMQQIESELSPEQKIQLATMDNNAPSPSSNVADSSLNSEEEKDISLDVSKGLTSKEIKTGSPDSVSTQSSVSSRRTSTSTKTPKSSIPAQNKSTLSAQNKTSGKDNKRKPEPDSSPLGPGPKKPNLSIPASDLSSTDIKLANKTSDGHSRAGRKIKPKLKYSDFEMENGEDLKEVKKVTRNKSVKDIDEEFNSDDSYLLATNENSDQIKIPLKLNRPNFEDAKPRSITAEAWANLILDKARDLKKQIESGLEEFTEAEVTDLMHRYTLVQKANVFILRTADEEKVFMYQTYHAECDMLQFEVNIRKALSLNAADTTVCLEQMSKLKNLNITALMLKKHPQVIHTLRKLRMYVGNTIAWNMDEIESKKFHVDSDKIRSKADEIINSFKMLFFRNNNSVSFWEHFSKEVALFNDKTQHLSEEEMFSIIADPQ